MRNYLRFIHSKRAKFLFLLWKFGHIGFHDSFFAKWASRKYMALVMAAHDRDWIERKATMK